MQYVHKRKMMRPEWGEIGELPCVYTARRPVSISSILVPPNLAFLKCKFYRNERMARWGGCAKVAQRRLCVSNRRFPDDDARVFATRWKLREIIVKLEIKRLNPLFQMKRFPFKKLFCKIISINIIFWSLFLFLSENKDLSRTLILLNLALTAISSSGEQATP